MVPASIVRALSRVRQRECFVRLAWGGARWLALAGVLLGLCCLADWTVDRFRETPAWLRSAMLGAQIAAGVAAFFLLILRPLLRPLPDAELALWVEEQNPALEH